MIHDAKVLTLANPATWREKLGIYGSADWLALVARVAALETALDQAEARILALNRNRLLYCPADGLVYQLRLDTVPGGVTLNWEPYPVQLITVDGGASTTLGDVPAACAAGQFDTITAADGSVYDLSVVEVDGEKLVEWEEAN